MIKSQLTKIECFATLLLKVMKTLFLNVKNARFFKCLKNIFMRTLTCRLIILQILWKSLNVLWMFFWVNSVQRLDQTVWQTSESVLESVWMIRLVPCRTRWVVWSGSHSDNTKSVEDVALDLQSIESRGVRFQVFQSRLRLPTPTIGVDGIDSSTPFSVTVQITLI